jgi:uncharacterized protein (TIRG00374 family)
LKSNQRFLLNWGIKLIGIILLIALLRQIDLTDFFAVLGQFHWPKILLLELISALVILTKALRFKTLARRYAVPIDLKKSTIIYGSSMFFSTITPGRLGDFIKVFYLNNLYGSSLRKGLFLSLVDRIFDLLTIAIFALFGLALVIPVKSIITGCLVCSGLILILYLFAKKYLAQIMTKFVARLGQRFKVNLENIDLSLIFSRRLILPAALSLIPNGLIFVQMILISHVSQIAIAPLSIIGILSLGNLISMLPVTISGLGTRDAAFVYLFAKQGIPATQAMTLSLSFFLFNNLGILLFGLVLFLIFKPKTEADLIV